MSLKHNQLRIFFHEDYISRLMHLITRHLACNAARKSLVNVSTQQITYPEIMPRKHN